MLGNYDGVYGVKTGFTFNSGRCLVTACKRNDFDVIVVVLGANTKKIRTIDSVKVLNYTYNNYKKIDISNVIYENFYNFEDYFYKNISIQKSLDKPIIKLNNIDNTIFPIKNNELNSISSEIYSLNKLKAPISANTKIGEINIKLNNEILLSSNILLENNLNRKTWKIYYNELLQNFFHYNV